jgi:hypothetical protein
MLDNRAKHGVPVAAVAIARPGLEAERTRRDELYEIVVREQVGVDLRDDRRDVIRVVRKGDVLLKPGRVVEQLVDRNSRARFGRVMIDAISNRVSRVFRMPHSRFARPNARSYRTRPRSATRTTPSNCSKAE